MALIRKRKIWWEHVPEAAGYVVYASMDPEIFQPNRFAWEATPGLVSKVVEGKTELILPDEWPDFPSEPGMYHIAITSRDAVGNQSDPFLSSAQFRFKPPAAPCKGGIESL